MGLSRFLSVACDVSTLIQPFLILRFVIDEFARTNWQTYVSTRGRSTIEFRLIQIILSLPVDAKTLKVHRGSKHTTSMTLLP